MPRAKKVEESKVEPKVETPAPAAPVTAPLTVEEAKAVVETQLKKKRQPSAYIRFCNQEREKVKAEMPTLKFTEVGQELGKRWKALTPEQQASFKAPQ